jgi:uncharacterized protein (TIGR00661 family)
MKIIYGVCSWGIGHTARALPILRKLLAEHNELTVISSGRPLQILKDELQEPSVEYIDIPDYAPPRGIEPRTFFIGFLLRSPKLQFTIRRELRAVLKLLAKKRYDVILSDTRYGIYHRKIPSFFITNQLRLMNPYRFRTLELGSELYNRFFFKRYCGIIVPDFADQDDLGGDLTHNLRLIDMSKIHYVGPISDFKPRELPQTIDYLISLSGPPLERALFRQTILNQLASLNGNIAITTPEHNLDSKSSCLIRKVQSDARKINVYTYLSRMDRELLLNRAKLLISKIGFTTLSDMAVLRKKALFLPTPGQPEQLYLAQYHNTKRTFRCVLPTKLNLATDVNLALRYQGVKRYCNVDKAIETVLDLIYSTS